MLTIWLIVILASIIIEIFTFGNLICIWFTFGGIAAAILAALNVNDIIQYIVFFIVSILAMVIIRPLAYNYLRGNVVPTNFDRLIGKTAILTKEITENNWGELKIDGATWSATTVDNSPIEKGTQVKIITIDGAKLIVKAI